MFKTNPDGANMKLTDEPMRQDDTQHSRNTSPLDSSLFVNTESKLPKTTTSFAITKNSQTDYNLSATQRINSPVRVETDIDRFFTTAYQHVARNVRTDE
jgi:hypothetical protein